MLFNKVAGHFKNFFLKLKIGKKDEILSKYHLVARHYFKIILGISRENISAYVFAKI